MEPIKLLLAGSHAGTTAVAIVNEIRKRNRPYEIHWLGMEYKNLTSLPISLHSLESGKIENKLTKNTLPSLFKIPTSFLKGKKIINDIRPDLILSLGSAAGAIAAYWGNKLKVPVLIHEQTSTAGRANIFSSYFASKILVARESSLPYFNKKKTEVVGNPINSDILKFLGKEKRNKVKTILITGGSQGSVWINNAIKPILPQLLEKYYVIHQTGKGKIDGFSEVKHNNYFVFETAIPENMAEILSKTDIAISRSGANTAWELLALKIPSILIPIPWTYNDEQTQNAENLKKVGLARIILQKELTPQRLLNEIDILIDTYPRIIKNTKELVSPDIDASEKIVDIIDEYIKEKSL